MASVRNALIAVAALVALSAPASAQPPALYGVSWISNESNAQCTVYYKWGKDGAWKKYVVEKGRRVGFPWAYDGERRVSPDLYVRIDVDTDGVKFVEHILSRGASPDRESSKYGHHFAVKQLKGTDTRYIEAVSKNATVTVTDRRATRPKVN